jgi:hypothetical protein
MPPTVPDPAFPSTEHEDPAPTVDGADRGLIPAVPTSTPHHAEPAARDRRVAATRRALDRRVMAVVERMSDAFLALGPDWPPTPTPRRRG